MDRDSAECGLEALASASKCGVVTLLDGFLLLSCGGVGLGSFVVFRNMVLVMRSLACSYYSCTAQYEAGPGPESTSGSKDSTSNFYVWSVGCGIQKEESTKLEEFQPN